METTKGCPSPLVKVQIKSRHLMTSQQKQSSNSSNSRAVKLLLFISIAALVAFTSQALADEPTLDLDNFDDIEGTPEKQPLADSHSSQKPTAKDQAYISPKIKPDGTYLVETFDDETQFKTNWIQSKDPKYEGKWQQISGPDRPHADLQLTLPDKARHYAISSKLNEPFKFSQEKLIVQYEVQFRDGLDCGGAYVKLLRHSGISDLSKLTDKSPFTIMFGPDKCGSESKLHFIVQYLNPKSQEYEEKHWKQAKFVSTLLPAFSDKEHHIFKLVLEPNNNFEIFLDDKSVGKGNLLEDLDPPVNPPEMIVDSQDKKPADWDERAQIDDPDAKKPDDWDEDAPKKIEDPDAVKPSGWLDNEPKLIPDPEAKKPDDWEDMDGEWEAPLIENPACTSAPGCGEWKPPMIDNPNYKGKFRPAKIDNPNYKGKWAPRMIPNPDYFFDESPFKSLDPIGAVAFELWSMAENIAFDNLIITSNLDSAQTLQHLTWREKKLQAEASSPSLLTRSMHYLKQNPWLWAVVVLAVALPLFLFISYCCDTKKKSKTDEAARRKKTDESRPNRESGRKDKKNREDEESLDEEVEEEEEEEDISGDAEGDDDEAEEAEEVQVQEAEAPKRRQRQRKE